MRRVIRLGVVAALVATATSVLTAAPSVAATTFTVTTTAESGPGSLRQALINANATPNGSNPDVITFALPTRSSIAVLSPLPDVTDPVDIDNFLAPPLPDWIAIDGSRCACGSAPGLRFVSGVAQQASLDNLTIGGFETAIEIVDSDVALDHVGTGLTVDGFTPLPNGDGVVVRGASSVFYALDSHLTNSQRNGVRVENARSARLVYSSVGAARFGSNAPPPPTNGGDGVVVLDGAFELWGSLVTSSGGDGVRIARTGQPVRVYGTVIWRNVGSGLVVPDGVSKRALVSNGFGGASLVNGGLDIDVGSDGADGALRRHGRIAAPVLAGELDHLATGVLVAQRGVTYAVQLYGLIGEAPFQRWVPCGSTTVSGNAVNLTGLVVFTARCDVSINFRPIPVYQIRAQAHSSPVANPYGPDIIDAADSSELSAPLGVLRP